MTENTPQVGELVVYDGRECPITAVAAGAVEFADGPESRGTGIVSLEAIEPGKWGVIGRSAARPHRTAVGVQVTPATEGPTDG